MTIEERQDVLMASIGGVEKSAAILLGVVRSTTMEDIAPAVRKILHGAYCQLYAGLLYDFVMDARREGWIGPSVKLDTGVVQPTEDFIVDYLFSTLFKPLMDKMDSAEHMYEIKRHLKPMIEFRREAKP